MPPDYFGSYGDVFASVYDHWYHDLSDLDSTVTTVVKLSSGRSILELGIGTGRLAIPLSRAGEQVTGLDSSAAMLAACQAKEYTNRLQIVRADMAKIPFTNEFGLVLVAFNTFFNLISPREQESCIESVAQALRSTGSLIVEAFVPSENPSSVEYHEASRSDRAGGIVLTASTRDPVTQTVRGVHFHQPASGPKARFPWAIRYLYPHQLDDLCTMHNLELVDRWSDWTKAHFDENATHHISHYRLVS